MVAPYKDEIDSILVQQRLHTRQIGRRADDRLDMQFYRDIKAVTEAITRHENGRGSLASPNT